MNPLFFRLPENYEFYKSAAASVRLPVGWALYCIREKSTDRIWKYLAKDKTDRWVRDLEDDIANSCFGSGNAIFLESYERFGRKFYDTKC